MARDVPPPLDAASEGIRLRIRERRTIAHDAQRELDRGLVTVPSASGSQMSTNLPLGNLMLSGQGSAADNPWLSDSVTL